MEAFAGGPKSPKIHVLVAHIYDCETKGHAWCLIWPEYYKEHSKKPRNQGAAFKLGWILSGLSEARRGFPDTLRRLAYFLTDVS